MLCTAGKFLRADRRSRQGEVTSILCILGLVVNLISYAFYTIVVQSSYIFYNVDDSGHIMIFVVYINTADNNIKSYMLRYDIYCIIKSLWRFKKEKTIIYPSGFFFFDRKTSTVEFKRKRIKCSLRNWKKRKTARVRRYALGDLWYPKTRRCALWTWCCKT